VRAELSQPGDAGRKESAALSDAANPKAGLRIRPWRRVSQFIALLVFAGLPCANAYGWTRLSGNFLSFNFAGLPLADPLASLQALVGGGSFEISLLVGGGLALVMALALGRVFCSWICPYGLVSEWVFALSRGKKKIAPGSSRFVALRFGIVLAGLAAVAAVAPFPALNQLSLPGWYSRALQSAVFYGSMLYGALLFPVALILDAATSRRFWCRHICPQSVLISLMATVPAALRIRFAPRQCVCAKNDRACAAACSLGLAPRNPNLLHRLECTNCGDCVDACKTRGKALSLRLR
jgi:ferredoxin-type protein NapH